METERQAFLCDYEQFGGDAAKAKRHVLRLAQKQGYCEASGEVFPFEDRQLVEEAERAAIVTDAELAEAHAQGQAQGQKDRRATAAPVAVARGFGLQQGGEAPMVAPGMRLCPHCGAEVKVYAIACRYCFQALPPVTPPTRVPNPVPPAVWGLPVAGAHAPALVLPQQPNVHVTVQPRVTVANTTRTHVDVHTGPSGLVRLIYFCVIGWWLGMLWLACALLLACTVIGIPVALVMLAQAPQVFFL